MRQFISWPMLPNGIAFHLPLTTTASLAGVVPAALLLADLLGDVADVENLSSNRKAQLRPIAVMSAPEPFSAAVVIRVGRLPTLATS